MLLALATAVWSVLASLLAFCRGTVAGRAFGELGIGVWVEQVLSRSHNGVIVRKVIIFGNSGSGKSTLAAELRAEGLAHLDLDVLAWLPSSPPERRPVDQAYQEIRDFTGANDEWVVEGCYADLLELAAPLATEAIFMNLPVRLCQDNARSRPWEPHKYASKKAQDANLAMLLDWIAGYTDRKDALSYQAHRALYDGFSGRRQEITCNRQRGDEPPSTGA